MICWVYYFFLGRQRSPFPAIYEWLDKVSKQNRKAVEKCQARIRLLENYGLDLRRPIVDYLHDGIYELRVPYNRIQYRILYFYHGHKIIVLTHGLSKEDKVPESEIRKAIEFRNRFSSNPEKHLHREG